MAQFENIIFSDEGLHNKVKDYAERRRVTFSRATQELISGGVELYERIGNISPVGIIEENKGLKELNHILKSELRGLWSIVKKPD